jgi:ElaB/YqjD/DUF883 family membrane-anchored ribosome-binding protein
LAWKPEYAREATAAVLTVANRVISVAQEPAMDAGKELLAEFQKQAQADFAAHKDEINAKLQEELKTLTTDLQAMLQTKMKERVDKAAEAQRAFLTNSFPELLKDDKALDRVIGKLKPALEGATLNVMEARLTKAQKRLETVTRQVLDFLPEDKRAGFHAKMSEIWDRLGEIHTKREAAAKSGS